ncbi:hypothetical protein DVH24_032447 [Malus domestica]|uniref:NPH3 domain-containing protein n=1 Tax=Malus domestica TaxID=3750 RepID=A0A498J3M1_MALDO|nr:hypothetical protein DVH24_032447 [Malus domestica]
MLTSGRFRQKNLQFWENSGQRIGYDHKVSVILQGVLDLLPMGDKAIGFCLAILSRSLEVGLRINTRVKLQGQIVSLLHFAQLGDFLFPKSGSESISSSMELATMESIISAYVSSNMESDNSLLAGNTQLLHSYGIQHVIIGKHKDADKLIQ